MRIIDYIVFYAYIVLIVGIGAAFRKRHRSEQDFFLAERSLGWFPVGISIMVTIFTAINYAVFPTEIFDNGLYITASLPIFLLVAWPISRWFIPFFRKRQDTSAYEFLEERFDVRVRCLASALFICWRVVWMAVALYASARILSAVTGYRLESLILWSGLITVIYTAFGGLRAVVWTDVAQFFVLFGGIVAGLIIADIQTPGGFQEIFVTAAKGRIFRPALPYESKFFSFDPTIRVTFWSSAIGTFVAFLSRYGADQVVIQRYFAAKSVREARKAFWLNIICALAVLILLAVLGVAVYSHSQHAGLLDKGLKPMRHLSALILSLPWGGCGLIAAGLLAATMSSLDSGINACSAAWTKDYYHRLISQAVETPSLHWKYNIAFTLLNGALVIFMALGFISLFGRHHNIFVMVNKIINGFGSPLLAIVILGMMPYKIRPGAVFLGGLTGAAWSIYTILGIHGLSLHYYAVINLFGTFAACYAINLLLSLTANRRRCIS